jgi:FtsH-binding integral membrane protein
MNYQPQYMPGVVAYAPADVRAAFIRKVYHLFFVSILVTVGVGYFTGQIARTMLPLLMPLLIAGLVVGLIMGFARNTSGVNLALLMLYAAIQGAIAGPILTILNAIPQYEGVGLQAAVLTVAVFGGLSLYVLNTKRDFSYLGGFLFVAIIALLVGGIVLFFFRTPLLNMIYAAAGVLIFSGFILYDTSVIQQKLHQDQAVAGAISLYLDFIGLFWFILRLLMSLRR